MAHFISADSISYFGEMLKMLSVPAAFYELVSPPTQQYMDQKARSLGNIHAFGYIMLLLMVLCIIVHWFPYVAIFMAVISGWALLILIIIFSGMRPPLRTLLLTGLGIVYLGMVLLIPVLAFATGEASRALILSYIMNPYNKLRGLLVFLPIVSTLLPVFSGDTFFISYQAYFDFLGNIVPRFLHISFLVNFYHFINLAAIYQLSIVFNVLMLILIAALFGSLLSFLLLALMSFCQTAELCLPDAKKKGIPLGTFLLYLLGNSISFSGKTITYFFP